MFRNYLPAWLWALLILVLTLMPGQYMPKVNYWSITSLDKYVHFTIFLIQVFLLLLGQKKSQRKLQPRFYFLSVLIGILFGVAIEYVQKVIPHRSFDIEDMIANSIGAILGALFFLMYAAMKSQKNMEGKIQG